MNLIYRKRNVYKILRCSVRVWKFCWPGRAPNDLRIQTVGVAKADVALEYLSDTTNMENIQSLMLHTCKVVA